MDVWPVVRDERAALIADLEGVEGADWQTPSLCGEWTVHDVLAHLVDTAKTTKLSFVKDMAKARGDFDRANEFGVARQRADDPRVTLDRFREVVDRTTSPPAPRDTRLVEAIVHGEDIRRPLGLTRDYPPAAIEAALRYQLKTAKSFGGGKEYVAGLAVRATDLPVTMGEGHEVSGSGLDLLIAVSGRTSALARLDGAGLGLVRERIA